MRTLPLFLLAASPALACGGPRGTPLDDLILVGIVLLLNPLTWVVIVGFVVMMLTIAVGLSARTGSHSTEAEHRHSD